MARKKSSGRKTVSVSAYKRRLKKGARKKVAVKAYKRRACGCAR